MNVHCFTFAKGGQPTDNVEADDKANPRLNLPPRFGLRRPRSQRSQLGRTFEQPVLPQRHLP